VDLTVTGPVGEFAAIIPKRVVLRGIAGESVKGMATIVPKEKYPFKIMTVTARYGDKIHFNFEEIQNSDPKSYLLTIENLLTHKGRYADTIILKTDSRIRPELTVQVFGDIAESGQTARPIQ